MKSVYKKHFIALFCATAVVSQLSPAQQTQTEDQPATKIIKVCRAELTPLGKAARFQLTFVYQVKTNVECAVEKITKLSGQKRPLVIREDSIIKCIEMWKLRPSTDYVVVFRVGAVENSLSISERGGETIKLVL